MYKLAVRSLVRHGVRRLNAGDPEFLLRLAAPDLALIFAGDNTWSTMFRPARTGRHAHVTHDGIDEARAFAERFVAEGLQFVIEDILVNGPPWRTRVAIRAHDYIPGVDGDEYANRFVDFLEIRWGRIRRFEVYEDTERVAAWDQRRSVAAS